MKRKTKPIKPMNFKPKKLFRSALYIAGAGLALGLGMKAFKEGYNA
jgi:hypothetical protein